MSYLSEKEVVTIIEKLNKSSNVVITGHINPDGDCLGSSLAVFMFLRKYGLQPVFFLPNDFPEFLNWLPFSSEIQIFDKENTNHIKIIDEAEILFVIDYNDTKRVGNIGEFIEKSKAYKIMLDHHLEPAYFCDLTISDINVSSAAEITYSFLKQINPEFIDIDIAEAIMTGIIMDTGIFNFNSSNPETFILMAELLKIGADKQKIIHFVYNTSSESKLRMMGYVLNQKIKINYDKKTAVFSLSKSELNQFNYKPGDTEGFVNIPLTIKGVKFSIFFMESDNNIKVSLRSIGDFDVNEFARKHYKGGGHKNAAGGKSYKSMNSTLTEFENILKETEI